MICQMLFYFLCWWISYWKRTLGQEILIDLRKKCLLLSKKRNVERSIHTAPTDASQITVCHFSDVSRPDKRRINVFNQKCWPTPTDIDTANIQIWQNPTKSLLPSVGSVWICFKGIVHPNCHNLLTLKLRVSNDKIKIFGWTIPLRRDLRTLKT